MSHMEAQSVQNQFHRDVNLLLKSQDVNRSGLGFSMGVTAAWQNVYSFSGEVCLVDGKWQCRKGWDYVLAGHHLKYL